MSRTRVGAATALVALLLPLAVAGCGTADDTATEPAATGTPEPTPEPTTEPTPERFPDFAPTDYDFTLRVFCFCPGSGVPIEVRVRDDDVRSATWARGGRGVQRGEPVGPWGEVTIDDVIGTARDAEAANAARVEVEWPEGQAYPTSIAVDRSERIADEEIGYEVSDVVVAPPD